MKEWPEAPFKQTPNTSQLQDNIFSHGNMIIRSGNEFNFDNQATTAHIIEGLKLARELFGELTEVYGIEHAGFMPVVGKTQTGRSGEYIASHLVDGDYCVNPALRLIPDSQKPAAHVLLNKLTNYIEDKHEQGKPALSDIFKLEQYVYIPERDTMVLVDMDPYFEIELGGVFAYKDLQPLAEQLLDQDAYQEWDKTMSRIAQESEMIEFDENF